MATIILSVLIFGSAIALVVNRVRKGRDCGCGDCHSSCPVKDEIPK
ncbi:MAG: FeoB-associated Cys-rich membrane protein [Lactobacillales bacterium]|jgi:hypothetical protein|nr:FeoB-associated Cys-rich membrane protein [Lactobacillales bacterium]